MSKERGYANLLAIADSLGASTKAANLALPSLSSPIDRTLRFVRHGHRVELGSNGDVYYAEVTARSAIVCSVGKPEPDLLLTERRVGYVGRVPIYARSDGRFSPIGWITGDGEDLLDKLRLMNGESVLVSRDRIAAVIYPGSVDDDWERVAHLVDIAASVSTAGDAIKVQTSKLPTRFRHLSQLAESWAISDDLARSRQIVEADAASLRELTRRVEPEVSAINSYIDSHPTADGAAKLGALVETALEAGQELANREPA